MIENKPSVSIILTSYNHGKYISEAIASVLAQDIADFELIIIDDQSPDDSVDIIKNFKDPRIRFFINEQNLGMACSVNRGITLAKGEFIAHLNSDDRYNHVSKIKEQVKFLRENPNYGAVFTKARIIDDNGNINLEKTGIKYQAKFDRASNKSRYQWLNDFFYNSNCLCYPSVLIRQECYEKIGWYDWRYTIMLDWDMWIRLCWQYEIWVLEEKMTDFRVGTSSTSCQDNAKYIAKFETARILERFLEIKDKKLFEEIFGEIDIRKIDKHKYTEFLPFSLLKIAGDLSDAHQEFYLNNIHRFLLPETNLNLSQDSHTQVADYYQTRNNIIDEKIFYIKYYRKYKNLISLYHNLIHPLAGIKKFFKS